MSSHHETSRGDLLVLGAALIWGVAFYFQKTAMSHVGPLLFLGLRGAVAALVMLPFAMGEQRRRRGTSESVVPIAVVGGLVFLLAGSIQQFGIVTATVINTGFLTALYVVATPFAYWAIERRSPPPTVWFAVGLAFVGVWGLSGGRFGAFSRGDVLVGVAAAIWGIHIVVTGRSGRLAQPLTYTLVQFAVVAATALSLAMAFEPVSLQAILDAAGSILYVGVLSSALTFGIMAVALQHTSPPRASILLSVEVLFSAAAGYVLLGERLPPVGWAGAVLILAVVMLVRARGGRAKSERPATGRESRTGP